MKLLKTDAGAQAWSMTWLWQEVRSGSRTIFKDKWFFLTAILALGIGSTTAIFSVIYNVVLDPYPYRDGRHIFCPEVGEAGTSRIMNGMSVAEFLDFQEQNRALADWLGVTEESVLLKQSGQLKEYDADRLTGSAFQVLGMPALIGRGLLPQDAAPAAPPVFVLNYRVWKQDSVVVAHNIEPGLGSTLVRSGNARWGTDVADAGRNSGVLRAVGSSESCSARRVSSD